MVMDAMQQGLVAAQILQRLWPLVMDLYDRSTDRTVITREELLDALRNSQLAADRAEERLQDALDKGEN